MGHRTVTTRKQDLPHLLTFADQSQANRLLPILIEELRRPLSNLAAAAANLQANPEMSSESRADFIEIISRESIALTDRFEALVRESRVVNQPWPLTDVNSADLFGSLVQRLAGEGGMVVNMIGAPLWLRSDSHSLLLVLETLVRFIREIKRVREIDLEVLLGDRRVYLDLVWAGAQISQTALNRLMQSPLPEGDGVTVAKVLERHDSELWSQNHHRPGFALLRLPVPSSPRQWQGATGPMPALALAVRSLSSLDYVVVDTETTGLHPAGVDELLAIAAVRIGKGKILSSKRFERLVKPHHPIPAAAISLLAITGKKLNRAASSGEVLPQFRGFVGEAIMVAHSASFDLDFFRSQGKGDGIRFDNPLLDTMLMALLVDGQRTDLTLAGLAEWLGVEESGEQTTMGTCLLTARIFLRLVDRLAEQGLTTLGQVFDASTALLEQKTAAGEGKRDA